MLLINIPLQAVPDVSGTVAVAETPVFLGFEGVSAARYTGHMPAQVHHTASRYRWTEMPKATKALTCLITVAPHGFSC